MVRVGERDKFRLTCPSGPAWRDQWMGAERGPRNRGGKTYDLLDGEP